MYKLKLRTVFSAAHQLTNAYDEKCNKSLHGHNWVVEIAIATEKLVNNMVIDFTKVKDIVNKFDHKNLNEIMKVEPTAENIAKIIHDDIDKEMDSYSPQHTIIVVKVWEGEHSSITYTND